MSGELRGSVSGMGEAADAVACFDTLAGVLRTFRLVYAHY